jgi:hypothetical protein
VHIAGVRRFIRQRLSIADNASPEEVAMTVKKSTYARDYFISRGYIRHIRCQQEDIKYKRGVRDVDSVLAWVCTFASCAFNVARKLWTIIKYRNNSFCNHQQSHGLAASSLREFCILTLPVTSYA